MYIEALASFPFHTSSSCTLLSLLCGILLWFCFFTQILGMRVKTSQESIRFVMAQHDLFLQVSLTGSLVSNVTAMKGLETGRWTPLRRSRGLSHEYRKRFSLSVRSVYYLLEQCWLMRAGWEKGDSAYTLVAFQTSLLFA